VDSAAPSDVFHFGGFLLDERGGGLFRIDDCGARIPVQIGSRALGVLSVLIERHGKLVSKQEIMEAVWPDIAVEDGNLTVQISALRRVLDRDRPAGSCIQTVPSRGYRLIVPVRLASGQPDANTSMQHHLGVQEDTQYAPRLSVVVLPFQNLGGNPKEDYLGDAITDDLTGELSRIPGAFIVARASAYAYRHKAEDIRKIGAELGVRYAVEGSVRKIGTILRINVQLVSAETGAHLWSDRFDQEITNLAAGQEAIVSRIGSALDIEVVDCESARALRERPTSPDAFDLILRARSLQNQPTSIQRNDAAEALYEQALAIDPSALRAIVGLHTMLFQYWTDRGHWKNNDMQERANTLLAAAQSIAPHDEDVMIGALRLLYVQGDWSRMTAAAQHVMDRYPNSVFGYLYLARGKIFTGKAGEALPLLAKTIQLNPRDPYLWDRFWRTGFAMLLVGRYEESIIWHERALAIYPDAPPHLCANRYRHIAAALALSGRADEGRRALSEATRHWPFATVRSCPIENPSSEVYAAQIRRYQEGLRMAGLRDHAEEDADFGVAPSDLLREDPVGYTPQSAPGVNTIRTMALPALLAERQPIIIDTTLFSWGQSIPGAIGLKDAGVGGNLSDSAQARLHRKMLMLTGGDLAKPIVAVGWNSERFDGRNLALRLAALGFTNVHWYRGGREAWEVAGLPEVEMVVEEW
jgi:adenylate cyclase